MVRARSVPLEPGDDAGKEEFDIITNRGCVWFNYLESWPKTGEGSQGGKRSGALWMKSNQQN